MPNEKDVRHDTSLQRFQVGFRQDQAGFTADFVFPIFNTQGIVQGSYKEYTVGDHFQVLSTRMKGKQEAVEIEYDVMEQTFFTREYGAKHGWTQRDINATIGTAIRLPRKSARIVADTMMLDWQRQADGLITTGNISQNTTLAGAAQWNTATSNPVTDIVTGIRTIELATGRKPNRCVVGGRVWWNGLQNNADIVERVKATQIMAGIQNITPQLVGQVFDLDLRVASAIYKTSAEGQATVTTDYSLGSVALLFFADEMPDEDTPHFGTTFVSSDFETRRYNEPQKGRGGTTWVQTEMERDTTLIFANCGYLIADAVA